MPDITPHPHYDDEDGLVVPFDEFGNLLRKPWVPEGEVVWRPAEPFTARMHLAEFVRGKTAPYVTWLNEDNKFFPMYLADLVETLRTFDIERGGYLLAEWIPHRRGVGSYTTYGLRLNLTRAERRMARFGHV
ncbi:hypothetical protein GCM10023194_80830 [Planotetraspora phitsanulokensis]|uniref:Uncharacterized protein n=1 Tax=Planotetraspora phitsanulokensis TaxID=575192 RepID=A0A8J3UDL4_9ACTN|nr:hypothetical protein [Planotetraspora phitsanulokensis]GII42835.1 hypothetical protein Pph01_78380 [Planotetraspora phitsanulokensis]